MTDPTIALLKDLVAIDSVNPSLVPGGAGESAIAERIASEMRAAHLDVQVAEAAPGRPNVFGVIDSGRPGPALMLCGHSDTVGVEGMSAPFDPVVRDGKLFGRGAQDMKGGVASILGAARRLAQSPAGLKGRVIVAIVADEEYASLGADAAVKDWKADAAIVTEPTDLAIGVGHKGFEWVEVETHGVAAHGSRPDDGVDAILMMGRVLGELDALERGFIAGPRHPLLGRPVAACLAHRRRAGAEHVSRPLHALGRAADGDGRGAPEPAARGGGDPGTAADGGSALPRLGAAHVRSLALPDAGGPSAASACCGSHSARETTVGALSFWTDAAILGAAGMASVVFGPGGAGLHGLEEYVRLDEVLACREALVTVARRFCS